MENVEYKPQIIKQSEEVRSKRKLEQYYWTGSADSSSM